MSSLKGDFIPLSLSITEEDLDPFSCSPSSLEDGEIANFFMGTGEASHLPCFPTPPSESPANEWCLTLSPLSPEELPLHHSPDDLMDDTPTTGIKFSDIYREENPQKEVDAGTIQECADELDENFEDNYSDLLSFLNDVAVNDEQKTIKESASDAEKGCVMTEQLNELDTDSVTSDVHRNIQDVCSDSDSSDCCSSPVAKEENINKLKFPAMGKSLPSVNCSATNNPESQRKRRILSTSFSEPVVKMLRVSAFEQYNNGWREKPVGKQCKSKKSKNESINIQDVEPSRRAAVQAKINREKKKAYIKCLEDSCSELKQENVLLKSQQCKLETESKSLRQEVLYLKNVLANQSTLSKLLKNIGEVEGISLHTSFASQCAGNDVANPKKRTLSTKCEKASDVSSISSGICLHVDKDNVSLEFCSECARKAACQHS